MEVRVVEGFADGREESRVCRRAEGDRLRLDGLGFRKEEHRATSNLAFLRTNLRGLKVRHGEWCGRELGRSMTVRSGWYRGPSGWIEGTEGRVGVEGGRGESAVDVWSVCRRGGRLIIRSGAFCDGSDTLLRSQKGFAKLARRDVVSERRWTHREGSLYASWTVQTVASLDMPSLPGRRSCRGRRCLVLEPPRRPTERVNAFLASRRKA